MQPKRTTDKNLTKNRDTAKLGYEVKAYIRKLISEATNRIKGNCVDIDDQARSIATESITSSVSKSKTIDADKASIDGLVVYEDCILPVMDTIKADSGSIGNLSSTTVNTSDLCATNSVCSQFIAADSVASKSADCINIKTKRLISSIAKFGRDTILTGSKIKTKHIVSDTFKSSDASINSIKASDLSAYHVESKSIDTDRIETSSIGTLDISSDTASISKISSDKVDSSEVDADVGTFYDLYGSSINGMSDKNFRSLNNIFGNGIVTVDGNVFGHVNIKDYLVHDKLSNLDHDSHKQYVLSSGRGKSQTITGGESSLVLKGSKNGCSMTVGRREIDARDMTINIDKINVDKLAGKLIEYGTSINFMLMTGRSDGHIGLIDGDLHIIKDSNVVRVGGVNSVKKNVGAEISNGVFIPTPFNGIDSTLVVKDACSGYSIVNEYMVKCKANGIHITIPNAKSKYRIIITGA